MKTLAASQHKAPKLIRVSDVVERKMRWLWYPYIPMGNASLIFGPGGYGKSHIAAAITAAVTRGTPLPGQTHPLSPQNVLMLSAEDDLAVVLTPQLRLAGADLERVFVPETVFTLDKIGLRDLKDQIAQAGATIVFIDPIVRYLGGKVDMFRANEVREVIGTLHEMAQELNVAIIIVGHSRKGGEGDDWEKAMGSVDFINAVRSVMFVTKAPDGGKVFRHVKTNYGRLGDSIRYSIDDTGFHWGEFDMEDEHDPKPEEPKQFGRSAGQKGAAQSFLRQVLADGPVPAKEVIAQAADEGINERTLERAKRGVAESRINRSSGVIVWEWFLKDGEDLR